MAVISMKHFLEAGVHFGHQTKRWNPKMAPYIYGVKSGIHIIDLRQTLRKLQEAYQFVKEASADGKNMLFVGTKQSLQRVVLEEAQRCESPYINFRWLGGFLTNFSTVKQSIGRLQYFEEIAGEEKSYEGILKKEALQIERKREKLERSLGGVRAMKDLPGLIFIIDCKREHLAVREAKKLGIPIVGVADTNCDPSGIDYVIPGNDDSPKAVQLYANVISTAILEGSKARQTSLQEKKAGDQLVSEKAEVKTASKEEVKTSEKLKNSKKKETTTVKQMVKTIKAVAMAEEEPQSAESSSVKAEESAAPNNDVEPKETQIPKIVAKKEPASENPKPKTKSAESSTKATKASTARKKTASQTKTKASSESSQAKKETEKEKETKSATTAPKKSSKEKKE